MHPREVAIIGAVVLVLIVPWVTVRDIWHQPARAWSGARRSRWAWTALVVLVPVLGPAWYLRVVRPDMRQAVRDVRPQQLDGPGE